jgi:hypothetical protein
MRLCSIACVLLVASPCIVACEEDPGAADDAAVIPRPDGAVVDPADAAPPDPPDADVAQPDAELGSPDATPATADAMLPPAPSFANEIVPLLQGHCGGCHLKASGGAGGLSLGTTAELAYEALVGEDTVLMDPDCQDLMRVDPNNHDPMQSSLYLKLIGTTCGKLMPTGMNAIPLTTEEIETFRLWIEAGAPKN